MDDLVALRQERAARYMASHSRSNGASDHEMRSRSRSPRRSVRPILEVESDLRVLSWNIDGLDSEREPEDLIGRTLWVVKTINETRPHVVLLQELIDFNLNLLSRVLGKAFHIYTQEDPSLPYFVGILVHKATVDVIGRPMTISFPTTKMGRSALSVRVKLKSKPESVVECITAHLESLRESANERKKQLSVMQTHIDEVLESRVIQRVLFAGDLNIRDNEVPEKFKSNDCWVQAGRDKDSEYTWDLQRNDNSSMPNGGKPRCRFDRMYCFSPSTVSFTADSFQLVGTERVQGLDRFPSDHFGILASFKL